MINLMNKLGCYSLQLNGNQKGEKAMSWLWFALASAVMAALVSIFGKIGLHQVDPNTATTIRAVIMMLFLMGVLAVQGKLSQIGDVLVNKKAMLFIILSGVAGALSWLFYFVAIQKGEVAKVAPIDKLSVVLAVGFALLFLGERLSFWGGVGVAFIAVGVLITALAA
ncbi:transporter, EamA family [Paenibacillus larvae subsp. larvae]|uniref:Transporter, EamA family n=4 Tax=Paenibacillus larvae TaxID=1464 RepID=V9W1S6_9BACL|nr:transporter, EamA family [Paenibacillus larvae subsp. larvae DSM 25430]AVF24188.1 transporter, EamA family [Paenibacillus larvae subsp. larvae]AVF28704.1 transporter, EamA family [Paenibacillus larvae subsp. larvae]ETK29026.1 transporter, EamA family [Paenibacillus larvae subsp. larvae DSM 25719]QHZ53905.1 transporter, EamA family [Paenibacillus larvae subsp. larvae]